MNLGAAAEGRSRWDSVRVAVVAAVVFTLLRQRAMHGEDTRLFVLGLGSDHLDWLARHFLFLPTIQALGSVLRPLGASWFDVLQVAAIGGTALGLFALHRAGRILLGNAAGPWLPVALALVPSWFFFATAAEIHGLFVLPLGCAWWALAAWREQPTFVRAGAVGLACGFAATLHFTGYSLLPSLALTAWLLRVRPLPVLCRHVAVMVAMLLATVAVLALGLGHAPWVQFAAASQFSASWSQRMHAGEVPGVVLREFVLPFLPWALLALAAFRQATLRPWAWAALATLAVHAVPPILALSNPEHLVEHGAYLTAFAVPLVLASFHAVPRRVFAVGVVVSAGVAVALQCGRLERVYDPAFVTSVQALRAERGPLAMIVASRSADMEALTIGLDDQLYIDSDKVQAWINDPLGLTLPQWWDAMVAMLAGGRTLVVCDSARLAFASHSHPEVRALWEGHVARTCTLVPIERPALRGWVVLRKPG